MAGLFCEGFDHYAAITQILEGKWTASDSVVNKSLVAGRLGGQALRFNNSSGNNFSKTLAANYATLICGTTATVLATGTTVLSLNVWYWIEIKVTFANAGTIEVKLDGASEIASTAADTTNTANAFANQILIAAGSNGQYDFDDLYLCDNSGANNNDFLGIRRVQTVAPSGAGSSSQWTPSAGSNNQNVDDSPGPDDDTTYNSTATAGHVDLYAMSDLAGSPSDVAFVQTVIRARMDDAGPRSIRDKCKSGGTTSDGASKALSVSYNNYLQLRETDPDTGVKFTAAGFNAAEFGVENL
jgi:hypothetical protein